MPAPRPACPAARAPCRPADPPALATAMRCVPFRPLASPHAGIAAAGFSWPAGWPGCQPASQLADRTTKRKTARQRACEPDTASSGELQTQPAKQKPVNRRANAPKTDSQPASQPTNQAPGQPASHSHLPTRRPMGVGSMGGFRGFRELAGWWIGGPALGAGGWWLRVCWVGGWACGCGAWQVYCVWEHGHGWWEGMRA